MLPVNGLYGHIQRNNLKSLLLLCVFFLLFESLTVVFFLPDAARSASIAQQVSEVENTLGSTEPHADVDPVGVMGESMRQVFADGGWAPPITGAFCWLAVAWLFLNYAVIKATKARPVERRDEPRLYNIVENLSLLAGLPRPAIYVMETEAMNAYAAGLTPRTAMIAVSRGLLQGLDDDELEAVAAHEIIHIRNRDTRLVAVASLFSGILFRMGWLIVSFNLQPNARMLLTLPFLGFFFWETMGLVIWACFVVILGGWLVRFAISRARDLNADAGAVELTKNPAALASALRKIQGRESLPGVDVTVDAMLFVSNSSGPLSTHPSPRARVEALQGVVPDMAAGIGIDALSARREGLSWATVTAAANRTPKWVSHPYVLLPAVLLNFSVTYAIASAFNPPLAEKMSDFVAFHAPAGETAPTAQSAPLRSSPPPIPQTLAKGTSGDAGSTHRGARKFYSPLP